MADRIEGVQVGALILWFDSLNLPEDLDYGA